MGKAANGSGYGPAVEEHFERDGTATQAVTALLEKCGRPVFLSLAIVVATGARAASPRAAATSLTAGTWFSAQLVSGVSTKTSHVGDKVEATPDRQRRRKEALLLPEGSRLRGAIVAVRPADPKSKIAAHLRMEFNEIVLPDGRAFPAKASAERGWVDSSTIGKGVVASGAAAIALLAAGVGGLAGGRRGAVIGAAIGGVAGTLEMAWMARLRWRDNEYRKGSYILVRFDQDFTLSPSAPTKP